MLTQPATSESSSDSNAAGEPPAPSASVAATGPSTEYSPPNAVITVALFHAAEIGKANKYPSKGGAYSGDSDDLFLGMASVDLTQLLTGLRRNFDEWLPLSGTEHSRGAVRLVCEYEPSDPPPRPNDWVRFSSFCHAADLFPLSPGLRYRVGEVDGDDVLLSHQTPEGWVCSFQAHRYMLICEERHIGAMEHCQDELASLTERLAHSPLVHSVAETVERVAVDGLLSVGSDVVHGGLSLFGRWLDGGLDTAISDVAHATNMDGRYNPNTVDSLVSRPRTPQSVASDVSVATTKNSLEPPADELESDSSAVPLAGMPSCPLTLLPINDPVVAADGKSCDCWLLQALKVMLPDRFSPNQLHLFRPYLREKRHRQVATDKR